MLNHILIALAIHLAALESRLIALKDRAANAITRYRLNRALRATERDVRDTYAYIQHLNDERRAFDRSFQRLILLRADIRDALKALDKDATPADNAPATEPPARLQTYAHPCVVRIGSYPRTRNEA